MKKLKKKFSNVELPTASGEIARSRTEAFAAKTRAAFAESLSVKPKYTHALKDGMIVEQTDDLQGVLAGPVRKKRARTLATRKQKRHSP